MLLNICIANIEAIFDRESLAKCPQIFATFFSKKLGAGKGCLEIYLSQSLTYITFRGSCDAKQLLNI